jgi:dolichol-phosphate mannosyltransferase
MHMGSLRNRNGHPDRDADQDGAQRQALPRARDEAALPELTVVVPAHNEAGNVASLVGEIEHALRGRLPFEIVYVDDGSDDSTSDELRAARHRAPSRFRALRHPTRRGQSTALLTGIRAARGPWIATLDADGQNDPADIPRLLDLARAGGAATVVVGHRRQRRDSVLKRISSRTANGLRSWALRDACPDSGCGLKIFPTAAFLELPHFDHMHRFLPALFRHHGLEVRVATVRHRSRRWGESKYGVHDRLWVGLVDLLGVWWLSRRCPQVRVDQVGELE